MSLTSTTEAAVAAEREACAEIAEYLARNHDFFDGGYEVGLKIAAEIRKRNRKGELHAREDSRADAV